MPLPHSALRIPRSALASLLLAFLLTGSAPAQDNPFAAGVRTTPWLSPADEQKLFKLPPGFEINLVAAEPQIQKPLNMAFDERGRIWLTNSVEYPYAAPADRAGKDSIRVLEDTDGDGRFEKVTTFADGLNIPIGIYPWKGGCITFSIPNIWHLEDTDGDGVCDKRTILYGPFDTSRDTHGMVNSLRRGWDGWVYACHGFNNDSRAKGKDGHEVHLNSGNTFRFKLDGSRIEHFTHGQVNPFGMCFDELFNIFTADCHSKPIYQLLRGGYYPSFGKTHDGLGFVPPMMEHLHGSTAICGLVCYSGENFPAEYRGNFLSGNVMTSRINQNKPQYHGSTIKAIEQPDFLEAGDPWFRPVDLQIGPDGALYILDFYNRIIGHYEVPLTHPGRDRTSGRIWRVVYKGNVEGTKPAKMPGDLTKMSGAELIAQLDSPQLEHRLRVTNYLADVKGKDRPPEIQQALGTPSSANQQIAAMWILERLESLSEGQRLSMISDNDRSLRVHALKLATEKWAWQPADQTAGTAALKDEDAFVARAAAEAFTRHDIVDLQPLFASWDKAPAADNHRILMLRMALRNNFDMSRFPFRIPGDSENDRRRFAEIVETTEGRDAATYLYHHLLSVPEPDDRVVRIVQRVVQHQIPPPSREQNIASWARQRAAGKPEMEVSLLVALSKSSDGVTHREITDWTDEVARRLLKVDSQSPVSWTAVPLDGLPPSESPWTIQPRVIGSESSPTIFYSSLPLAETRTGIYRSSPFAIPEKLSFWCAGHSGLLSQPITDKNWVRLRDAKTGEVLAETQPPRSDQGKLIEWDLSKHAKTPSPPTPLPQGERGEGRIAYLELVDGDTGTGWAWLAVGRFSLAALNPNDSAKRQQLAAELIGKLKLASLRPQMVALVTDPQADHAARVAAAQALVALKPDSRASALAAALAEPSLPAELRLKMGQAIVDGASQPYLDSLREVMKLAPSRLQTALAETLAGDATGADALLTTIAAGAASPRLLLAPNVKTKLTALKSGPLDQRVLELTAKLPPANQVLDNLIADRRNSYGKAAPNLERGQAVFTKHCAACHQLEGKGAIVGPQLDGIGNRGLDRLIEDTLDPNRNVDLAFRTTTLRLADGRVLSGLLRREEGSQLVLADNQGKEFTVAKDDIDEQHKTPLSLMPANVGEIVPEGEFFDLLGWLLSKRAVGEKPRTALQSP